MDKIKIKHAAFIFMLCISLTACKQNRCLYSIPMGEWICTINADGNNKSSKRIVLSSVQDNKFYETTLPIHDNESMYSFTKNDGMIGFFLHYTEAPYYRYVILKNEPPYKLELPVEDSWISSSIISNGNVIYSTEFTQNTIKKINIASGKVYEYEGWFPNVEIYPAGNDNFLGVFEYENKWYCITADSIIESVKTFNLEKDQFSSYAVN